MFLPNLDVGEGNKEHEKSASVSDLTVFLTMFMMDDDGK